MDQATYERLRAAVEEECRRKIEALDFVAVLWREHTVPPKEELEVVVTEDPADEPGDEPSKLCKTCGKKKPLPDFPKKPGMKDGRANKCKVCTREYQNRLRREAKERREKEAGTKGEVRELRSAPAERHCANGTSCAAVDPDDLVPTPAILDGANPGPLCRRCQRRTGVA